MTFEQLIKKLKPYVLMWTKSTGGSGTSGIVFPPSGGDFVGPAGATADDIVVFNGVTGKLGKDGGKKISQLALALGADDNYVTNAEKLALHAAVTVSAPIDLLGQAIKLVNDAAATVTEIDTSALASSDTKIPTSKAVLTAIAGVVYPPNAITFGNAAQEYDLSGTTWVTATAGVPDVAGHLLAASLLTLATPYDGTYFAVRESAGAASPSNPLTVEFTFPTVATFNAIKFRSYYHGSPSHQMVFELYNGATYDTFVTFSGESEYVLHTAEILVPATYVIAGNVVGRFRHLQSGVTMHYLDIDYIVITSGGGGGGGAGFQSAIQTPFTPSNDLVGTNVQSALTELSKFAWPVGSIFISVVAINPNTLLGYGTWAAFGQGKVLIGIDVGGDVNFDTVKEIGGAKTVASSAQTFTGNALGTHIHDAITGGTPAGTVAAIAASGTAAVRIGTAATSAAASGHTHPAPAFTGAPLGTHQHAAITAGTPTGSNTPGAATSVVQPYIVVYMWERTA